MSRVGASRHVCLACVLLAAGLNLVCGASVSRQQPTPASSSIDPIDLAWERTQAQPPLDSLPGYRTPYQRPNKRPQRSLFERYPWNPVLEIGPRGTHDSGHAEYPSVIEVADSLWMYYAGFGAGGYWSIGAAHSRDGIDWRKHGVVLRPDTTAGAWDGSTNAFPSVIVDEEAPPDERFRLYYAGKRGNRYDGIGLAVSADGIHWRRHGRVLTIGGTDDWDGGQIVDPAVIRTADGYRMYYCGTRSQSGLFAVGVALSADGKQWVKYPDNPVYALDRKQSRGLYTVDVLPTGDGYLLFESTPDPEGFYDIFATHSSDGLSFDAGKRLAVLGAAHDGTWDHVMVYGMDAVRRGPTVYLWFNGIYRKMVTRGGQIGLARVDYAALREYLRRAE